MSRQHSVTVASIAAILLVLAGGTVWLYAQKSRDQQESSGQYSSQNSTYGELPGSTNQTTATTNEPGDGNVPVSATLPGTYQPYSKSALKDAGQRDRVLFFHAPWCPQCRALEADIKDKGVPKGVAIFKIDYDSSQDLRQAYGVTQQTTVVHVNAEGSKIRSFLPYSNPTLANALDGLGLQ